MGGKGQGKRLKYVAGKESWDQIQSLDKIKSKNKRTKTQNSFFFLKRADKCVLIVKINELDFLRKTYLKYFSCFQKFALTEHLFLYFNAISHFHKAIQLNS